MVLKSVKGCPVFVCPVCKLEKSKSSIVKTIGTKKSKEKIVIIGKEDQELKTNPTTKINCPRCDNNLAFTWQVQTRSGDEGATQFFRCTKCDYTFRLYT
jgi:DNA-directed RNA polymerase subunit M